MEQFEKLGIEGNFLKAISELGISIPTEIQTKTIPLVLAGKDIIAGSATGSGKTLAFGLGLIQKIEVGNGIKVLILAPTRELAEQIQVALKTFAKYKKVNICAIYGGVAMNPQFTALETADIVVATPGRLLDHMQRGTINLKNVKHLVLDEADRMLDMGFYEDVKTIMAQCPEEKQTLLFSATIDDTITDLANRFMNKPTKINVNCYVDPKKLSQVYYDVPGSLKLSLLLHLLKKEMTGLVMVFCNSRAFTDSVAKGLSKNGIEAMAIHGGLSQHKRQQVLSKFHSTDTFVLVCTDVAARGLDIPNVSHVYNFDMPDDSKQYIHRIGRTARAGKEGRVINLIGNRDYENFNYVLSRNDLTIKKLQRPYFEKIEMPISNRERNNPRGNSRSRSRRDLRGNSRRNSNERRERTSGSRYDRDDGSAGFGTPANQMPNRASYNSKPRNTSTRNSNKNAPQVN